MKLPSYEGSALSVLARITDPGSDFNIWQWGPSKYPLNSDLATIDRLTAEGYEQVPCLDGQFTMSHLLSQCCDVEFVENHLWAKYSDIEQVRNNPVTLAFTIEENAKVVEVDGRITMLQFLPLPRLGEWASLDDGQGSQSFYYIGNMPDYVKQLAHKLNKALLELARPGSWSSHNDLAPLCMNELAYQRLITNLHLQAIQGTKQEKQEAKTALIKLQQTHTDLAAMRQSWLRPDWLFMWGEIRSMAQQLAAEYWKYHQQITKKTRLAALPEITSTQTTRLPGKNGFRGLTQSFGPGLQSSLWNTETSTEMQLITPNQSLLRVMGKNEHERFALHKYVADEMGVEGLKHLVTLLHMYYAQTHGKERKDDARVTPRQLLIAMGYGNKADDKEEQRKIMHTILYLSRTWITSNEVIYEQEQQKAKGGKRKRGVDYSPLIVLEALKPSQEGGILIPEAIEFHLGKEFYDMLFGEHQQYFALPTARILGYHGKNEQQEICLAFYLSNYLMLNNGHYNVHFPTMLEGSGIRLAEAIEKGHDRTRDALRVLYALERLQMDGWIQRSPHENIDTALAVEYILDACKKDDLSPETYKRITNKYAYLKGQSIPELRKKRREALQHLLKTMSDNTIKFHTGDLLKAQAEKLVEVRQKAIDGNDQARVARAIKAAKVQTNRNLAKDGNNQSTKKPDVKAD